MPICDRAGVGCSVEVLLADGRAVAGAAKQLPCDARAHAELEGLLAMQGKPYLVHCLAAFLHTTGNRQYMTIVME